MNNKVYVNNEAVLKTDKISEEIYKQIPLNATREEFFPRLINAMNLKVGAEIGVDGGDFSWHLLNNTCISKLYCVDCWMDNFGSDFRPGAYDPIGENRKKKAINKLIEFDGRFQIVHDDSFNASQVVPNNSLDFCYIDGDHSLEGIYVDLYTWIHKVKKGGIISGHDFKDGRNSGMKNYWGEQLDFKVETVVRFFCDKYGYKLNVVGNRVKSWWFAV
jgi:hypothetical protein